MGLLASMALYIRRLLPPTSLLTLALFSAIAAATPRPVLAVAPLVAGLGRRMHQAAVTLLTPGVHKLLAQAPFTPGIPNPAAAA